MVIDPKSYNGMLIVVKAPTKKAKVAIGCTGFGNDPHRRADELDLGTGAG
jgi:hypothetical protein